MRAVVCREWCNPSGLRVEDVPAPPLAPGGVRIAVRAAGLNFADTLIIAGTYQIKPLLPFSPGFEVTGRVFECAAGVTRCKPGDRVTAVIEYGGFAQQVVAPEDCVFVLPDNVDDVIAATFPAAYGTSHLLRVCADAGADHVVDSRAEDLRDRIKALTGGRGVDVVYDPVGGRLFEASLRSTAAGGRILIVGFASGEVPQIPANILLVKNISAIGYYWGAHRTLAPQWMRASCEELLGWLARGSLRPHVSQTYPLNEATPALQALRARRTTGKVVLTLPE